ncbi:LysE/ArgO family amino acid transporter [Curtobacterium aurantiacum]|uniref:LysE family transporter n=1 Tax=Curtobacterium aurantiacum TaxID=3236919 RepID=A0ABS5VC31_9MICO|nr:LysE family transporter [Curtobacterium flaccumfaciens]MBT1543998.1 LysE family transporter [Curtobacterium flaccumfaciens pv. flaccumfaciens]MBT1586365.1 LysE family transporter [Curtobacterium flaccumfaciens pv. flaccumfaciens]
MTELLPLLSGLGTGLALIVAIGVQNTYLLRLAVSAGLRVVAAAVVVCALSDALLIVAGVLGVGAVVERFPVALLVIRFVGAAFLLAYGVLAARRALRPSGDAMRVADEAADDGVPERTAGGDAARAGAAAGSGGDRAGTVAAGRTRTVPPGQVVTMRTAVLTMLVFTWANPHVYLDTLVFLGSVANQQGADHRWLWTIGAVAASCLWFAGVGFGGRLLRPLFEKPLTWRVFDGLVAVVMLAFGVLLLAGA